MARTNFSGPINEGSVQQTLNKTGASNSYVWDVNAVTGKNRNVGFVKAAQSFYFDHNSVTLVSAGAATISAAARPATGLCALTADAATIGSTLAPAINGNRSAAQISITSAADDTDKTLVITGTDIYGCAQTESRVMVSAGVQLTLKNFSSISSAQVTTTIGGANAQAAGNVSLGVIATNKITVLMQSDFNGFPGVGFGAVGIQPGGTYGSTVTNNLANNIIIPKFSRITNISMIQIEAYNQTFSIEFGGNLNTDGSNTNTHDMNMFTTSSADLKAVGQYNLGGAGGAGGLVPAGNGGNILNVSNSDTLPFTSDKLMTATVDLGAAVNAGESLIVVDYLQAVNATN
jgi:hypothetical protein|tara:strand:+ start:26 stop:1063 length:1038 start_codon:yes stop_codon:yes gene_type:complete